MHKALKERKGFEKMLFHKDNPMKKMALIYLLDLS